MKRQIFISTLLAAALLLSGCSGLGGTNRGISGSGTIEADEYQISSELTGKVAAVNFDEGDTVQSGDVLFSLDNKLLEAQLNENQAAQAAAQANLEAAQANQSMMQAKYQATLKTSREANKNDREDLWQDSQPTDFDLQDFPIEEQNGELSTMNRGQNEQGLALP